MSIILKSGSSSDLATVNSDKELLVNPGIVGIKDSQGRDITTTENGYLRTSQSNLIHYDQVDGAALNTNIWQSSVSNMTVVQANGFIGLNAGAATTASAYAIIQSVKYIPLYGTLPLRDSTNAKIVNIPEANATVELGIGTVSANSAATDGAFFRWGPAGQFFAVINNGGSESSSAALVGAFLSEDGAESITLPPSPSVIHLYEIEIVEDAVKFYVDDILIVTLNTPSGQAYPFNAGRQQKFARVYNSGSVPSLAPQIFIGQTITEQEDLNQHKFWSEVLASQGKGSYQSPVTAFGQTANHTNSTSPVSAALSNVAAGYTTLGGRFQFAAVAGAVTDFAIFAYQVPVGYQLYVNTVTISTVSTGAIGSAITPTILDWGVGVNSSAVSLATADGAGTWAPRRIPLGMQTFALSTVIGAAAPEISRRLDVPLVIDSGRFFHVILQVPVGAATASQVFRGNICINGYFE